MGQFADKSLRFPIIILDDDIAGSNFEVIPTSLSVQIVPWTKNEKMAIALTVDAVVLGRSADGVKVLLVRRRNDPFKGKWALPGGFVDEGEGLEAACLRELHEETGLRLSHIDQFHAFGHPHRDPRGHTVSVAHVGHTEVGSARIRAGSDAGEVEWHSIAQLPELAFDHSETIHMALTHLFGESQD